MARKPLSQLGRDARYRINLAVRKAAVEIMNDLAEAGPVYTGEIRDSWIAVPVGTGARGSAGGGYPYTLSQVPQLSTTVRELGRRVKFTIENTAAHAEYALDLREGVFIKPEYERESPMPGNTLEVGTRSNPSFRGDIDIGGSTSSGRPGEAESSAPLDWYVNYLDGGGLQDALARGVRLGFSGQAVTAEE
jgi:hypothetical protein